jgi:type I restriction enzyme R subunit
MSAYMSTFTDADLEKLYVFARLLRRYLPPERDDLPREIQQNIDMESYRVQQTWKGKIKLERGNGEVEPIGTREVHGPSPEEIEPLSQIVRELNERFGTDFTDEDKVFIQNLEQKLAGDQALVAAVLTNTLENARLAFDHVASDRLQDMVDANFKFYKRITDDKDFGKFFLDWLFERFRKSLETMEESEHKTGNEPA